MGRNILVINVDIRETRVALIENGIIAELHLERESSKGTLGNIYLGKVSRVLPGMQAAFIDVGLERAAFLHVEDLIRPDDFEAYLQGHRRGSEEERETRSSDDEGSAPALPALPAREEDDDVPLVAQAASVETAPGQPYDDDDEERDADAVEEDEADAEDAAYARADEEAEGDAAEDEGSFAAQDEIDDEATSDERARGYDDRDAAEAAADDQDDAAADDQDAVDDQDAEEQDAAADDRDAAEEQDAAADEQDQDDESDVASAEAAAGDFASEPVDETTPVPEASAAAPDAEPSVSAAEDARVPEAEASDPGLLMSDVLDAEPIDGDVDATGTPGEPLPDGEVLAGGALEVVPEGDSEITVAQQRRRRGGRRDRVRRSRSTRDRLPADAAAAAPSTDAAPQDPARPPLADVRLARDQRQGPREPRQPSQPREPRQGGGGRNQGEQRHPQAITIRSHQTTPERGQGGRGDRRRDGRRDGRDDRRRDKAPQGQAQGSGRRDDRRRDNRRDGGRPESRDRSAPQARTGARGRNQEPPRISKTTPIREVVREGQEVLVQISKEPIGTKGARVTSHISLPGRYVVYLPTVDHVGISKRIGSEKERSRLREAIESMKPPQGGLIVRTVAEGLTKKQLKADVGYLVRLWGEVVKKRETGQRAPSCLYSEVDLILKTARDLFTDDIEKIVIDSREEYFRLRKFIEMFMPERIDAIELYEGEEPIFDAYGIEDEIQRALARKVPLPSGGYLIIDQAEALTAIDVNTGRFVGKGSKDLEETILATNLEAVEEIAYQLRFRNIGGLIILDLIDMERPQNREKVRRRMEELLAKDKAKTTLNRISELGLIEMTRKRTRESLGRTILEPCFYCDGTGQLQSKQTIAYEILRQIRRERMNLPGYSIIVNAHPAIIDLLKNDERDAVTEAERIFQRRIDLVPRKEYHLEQFDLQGK
ncbi:MAG: Rne/Rng family ribonuclease [Polyangiaceae bacterium]